MGCDSGVMIWNPLERFLWGIAIAIAIICGIYFLRIIKRREVFKERIIMSGLTSLLLGFAFSLLFTFFQVFYIPQVPGDFSNNTFTFCGNYELVSESYEILGRLSYISLGIGGMFFVLPFDIIIKRTKYLLTISFLIIVLVLIATFFLDYDFARIVFNIPLILSLVIFVPFILYLYTKWSHFEFKAVSSFLFFGFILFMISLILAERAHKKLEVFPLITSPLFFIAGCCIIIIPIIIDPKVVSRPLIYWVIFAILTITLLIVVTIIDIIFLFQRNQWSDSWRYFIGAYLGAIIYFSILLNLIIKSIRTEIISVREK